MSTPTRDNICVDTSLPVLYSLLMQTRELETSKRWFGVRLGQEHHAMLMKLAEENTPPTTMQAQAEYLIEQEAERRGLIQSAPAGQKDNG